MQPRNRRDNHNAWLVSTLTFLVIALIQGAVCPVVAGMNQFVEEFTSTTYKDAATTAWWRTNPGRLELYPFGLNETATEVLTQPRDVVARGPFVYVLTDNAALQAFEILIPTNPILYNAVAGLSFALGLDVVGHHAYVADGTAGLRIIDLDTFSIVGTHVTAAGAENVQVVGGLAYVAIGLGGVEVVNVSNPGAPSLVGAFNTSGEALDLAVDGNHCYVADGTAGLRVIDISNPASPIGVGSFPTAGSTTGIVVEGNVAYLSNDTNGMVNVDVSDPTSPSLLGLIGGIEGWTLTLTGNTAYLGRTGDVLVVDVTNPASPSPFTSVSTNAGLVIDLDTNGEYVYAADFTNGLLRVIEVFEPSPPAFVSRTDPGRVGDLVLEGDILYATGIDLYSIDVSNPSAPAVLDTLPLASLARDLDVDGNFAYVADFDSGMCVVDISIPSSMSIVGRLPRHADQYHGVVAVEGDFAYLGGSGTSEQFHVIDVSDPTNPFYAATYSLPGGHVPQGIWVEGRYAYVTVGSTGLDIVDISNPLSPNLVRNVDVLDSSESVIVYGPIAYVTSNGEGIYVIDVSVPSLAEVVAIIPVPGGHIEGLAISGTHLFTSVNGEGLRVYSLSNPYSPVLVGIAGNATDPRNMVVAGEHVFHAVRFDGLDVLKVFARDFELEERSGRSVAIDGGNDDVYAARLVSTRVGGATWALSPNDGVTWYSYPTEGAWVQFQAPGNDLRWNVALTQTEAGVNPSIDRIEVQMAFIFPVIESIQDIPNDQGRQVRVTWQFSGLDVAGSATPITNYAVYRRIDGGLSAAMQDEGNAMSMGKGDAAPELLLAGWDFIGTVPATGETQYSAVIPTLADSTIVGGPYDTTVLVRALTATPTTFFDSPADSGYSVDNLVPNPPAGLIVAYNSGSGNGLGWNPAEEADFDFFRVYRSTEPGFNPTPQDLVHTTSGTGWTDGGGTLSHSYKVTTVDFSGNESAPAAYDVPSSTRTPTVPGSLALHGASPNPFNPMTTIGYDVPSGGAHVEIVVFDPTGRRVHTLVSALRPEGRHQVQWNGRDEDGVRMPSGLYFYRMRASEGAGGVSTGADFVETKRMVLLK